MTSNWELDHPTLSRHQHDRNRSTTSTSYHTLVQHETSFRGRGRRGGRGPRDQTTARGGRGRDQSTVQITLVFYVESLVIIQIAVRNYLMQQDWKLSPADSPSVARHS
jgi:hypothetical protein